MSTVDLVKTGKNIERLRKQKNLTVMDLKRALNFSTTQAIYKWQRGECLPTIDNLIILSELFNVKIDDIIVRRSNTL